MKSTLGKTLFVCKGPHKDSVGLAVGVTVGVEVTGSDGTEVRDLSHVSSYVFWSWRLVSERSLCGKDPVNDTFFLSKIDYF